MSLVAIQDVPPKDEAFFLRKQNKPVLKQLLEIIVKLGVPRQKVPKRKHSKPVSYRVSVWRTPACVHPTRAQRWRSWHQRIDRPSAPMPPFQCR